MRKKSFFIFFYFVNNHMKRHRSETYCRSDLQYSAQTSMPVCQIRIVSVVSHISECNQPVSSSYSVVVIRRLVSVIKVHWSAKVSQQRLANISFHPCILFSFLMLFVMGNYCVRASYKNTNLSGHQVFHFPPKKRNRPAHTRKARISCMAPICADEKAGLHCEKAVRLFVTPISSRIIFRPYG